MAGKNGFKEKIGYKKARKQYMKLGEVFRSEDLSRMSKGDRDELKELGIKCIIDLRNHIRSAEIQG